MKILFGIVAILIVVGSLLADYKWKQWMNRRRNPENPSTDSAQSRPPERP